MFFQSLFEFLDFLDFILIRKLFKLKTLRVHSSVYPEVWLIRLTWWDPADWVNR